MTLLDTWAVIAAAAASGFLAVRSQMLRPTFTSLQDAPALVYLALSGLAIVCGGCMVSIWAGAHASPREALLLTALAIAAAVLFLNLRRQSKSAGPLVQALDAQVERLEASLEKAAAAVKPRKKPGDPS